MCLGLANGGKSPKMTDKEIIKALEFCKDNGILAENCDKCAYYKYGALCMDTMFENILDLINRQQEELEEARIGVKSYKGKYESAVKTAKELKTVITEKQAEIEKLTINMNAFGLGMKREKERADNIRAEAIKEFVKRLKEKAYLNDGVTGFQDVIVEVNDIDNLVKEMVGADNDT